jgi:hypothetical protein
MCLRNQGLDQSFHGSALEGVEELLHTRRVASSGGRHFGQAAPGESELVEFLLGRSVRKLVEGTEPCVEGSRVAVVRNATCDCWVAVSALVLYYSIDAND